MADVTLEALLAHCVRLERRLAMLETWVEVQKANQSHVGPRGSSGPRLRPLADFVKAGARVAGVPVADFIGPRRTKALTVPRCAAMHLARVDTHASTLQVGRAFGGRDHTTVIYASREVERRPEKFEAALTGIRAALAIRAEMDARAHLIGGPR